MGSSSQSETSLEARNDVFHVIREEKGIPGWVGLDERAFVDQSGLRRMSDIREG